MVSRKGFLGLAASLGACGFSGCAGFPAVTSTRSPNSLVRHLAANAFLSRPYREGWGIPGLA